MGSGEVSRAGGGNGFRRVKPTEASSLGCLPGALGALSPTHQPLCAGPWRLEGFWEGREAQKDSGWLRPGGHWPRSGWMPRKKRHRGGPQSLEAAKPGYSQTTLDAGHRHSRA